jgi:hypothetical protein
LAHTFLFEEALWDASGAYYDAAGTRFPTEGRTVITHQTGLWINEGTLKILSENPMEFRNRYEVMPFPPGSDRTVWHSYNPDLEELEGWFVIVEDAIMSPWRSKSGQFWGQEVLIQVNDDEYRGRGFAFHGETKMSSWAVRLVRVR